MSTNPRSRYFARAIGGDVLFSVQGRIACLFLSEVRGLLKNGYS